MKSWAYAAGAAAAIGALAAVVVAVSRARRSASLDDIPRILEDCQDKVKRIELDLQRIRTASRTA
jgi:hypothetical protein